MSVRQEAVVRLPGEDSVGDEAIRVFRLVPPDLREAHRAVVLRARTAGASSLVLTGSTARGRRTEISDLDYHLVGRAIETTDVSRQIDLHALSIEDLEGRLRDGDDFVQWSLRFGIVVFDDDGVWRAAAETMRAEALWPDVERKRRHAARSLDLSRRFVATGDVDGATVQVRTALSLAARAYLLGIGVFPLSRAELPEQLSQAARAQAGRALEASIASTLTQDELARAVQLGEALLTPAR